MIPVPPNLVLKIVAGVAAVLMLALLLQDRNRWKGKSAQYAALVSAERAAHGATVANYRAAAEQARAADTANIARVKAEQATINERTAYDFEIRIAAARARSERLRSGAQTREADPGSRGAAPVPGLSASAKATAKGAAENRLPPAEHRPQAEVGPLGTDDALIATEQAIQLDELIKWVRQQAAVPQRQ